MASAVEDRPAAGPEAFLSLHAGLSAALTSTVERVKASVVQVQVDSRGAGAGVIWRPDGGVLTNYHVVGEAEHARVALADGRSFQARVAARGRNLDLARLEVPAADLPAAAFGSSSRLRVGELVFAVGHPWGQRAVTTAGIVSAVGPVPVGEERALALVRSDVRLAPGNSGGPLVNAAGQVVGINSMIVGGDMSVAIPSDEAQAWLGRGVQGQPYLGVEVRPVVVVEPGARPGPGLLITALDQAGPALGAGVLIGDVFLRLNGHRTPDAGSLLAAIEEIPPGVLVTVELIRAGRLVTVQLRMGEQAENR